MSPNNPFPFTARRARYSGLRHDTIATMARLRGTNSGRDGGESWPPP